MPANSLGLTNSGAHAESLGVEHAIALHDGDGYPGYAAAAHDVADDVVEAVDRRVNAAARNRHQRLGIGWQLVERVWRMPW